MKNNYCKICQNIHQVEVTPEVELICADVKMEEIEHFDWHEKMKIIRTFENVAAITGESSNVNFGLLLCH